METGRPRECILEGHGWAEGKKYRHWYIDILLYGTLYVMNTGWAEASYRRGMGQVQRRKQMGRVYRLSGRMCVPTSYGWAEADYWRGMGQVHPRETDGLEECVPRVNGWAKGIKWFGRTDVYLPYTDGPRLVSREQWARCIYEETDGPGQTDGPDICMYSPYTDGLR
ncbi:uncharacterized protein EDB93DRAFT_1105722 [Suillus bovinus]|uniref:uncharacterized protein n=1 Tax=Suillus bovinus TaxID=48563 RepID=UPI001B884C10|nr:uncharacterized protein EDB93DRAFT_1105722 [Suillus bovinus]KAG2141442.1 hypothetical protein EDB93DRAFT_1105722 [Suillus bovinus]